MPYTDDVLYDPEGNIRFGAWYIGHLLQKFKGQIPLGAGSLQRGAARGDEVDQLTATRPLDEFVELVPYTQTREYMKKVLDIYSRYCGSTKNRIICPTIRSTPITSKTISITD